MRLIKSSSLLLIAALTTVGFTNANAEIFKGFPDIILCKPGQASQALGELVFYIEGRGKSNTAYYKSIGRQTLAVKVGSDGIVKAETPAINDCIDKSIQELRKQGRTFNFTK